MLAVMLQPRTPSQATPWPLLSAIDLGKLPGAVPCARRYTAYVLSEWAHLSHLTDNALVIVSELVTNAICHGTAPMTLVLMANSKNLLIEVWDTSMQPPTPSPHAIDAEGGRGLIVVASLSEDWSYFDEPGGKCVWTLL